MLRVGFLSTAQIAKKNWAAIFTSGTAVVSAVASRDKAKAQAFIDDLQASDNGAVAFKTAPIALGSYDELFAADAPVDAVYIPVPLLLRQDLILAALRAGKHVISEKPLAVDPKALDPIYAEAAAKNLTFLDGTMLTHGKRIKEVQKLVTGGFLNDTSSGNGGDLLPSSATAVFTFPGSAAFLANDIRTKRDIEGPLGALGDVGWYCIRYTVEALSGSKNIAKINRARADTIVINERKVNMTMSGTVEFQLRGENKKFTLQFWVSFLEAHQQRITFRGNAAALSVNDFCLPFLTTDKTNPKLGFEIERNSISSPEPDTKPHLLNHVQNVEQRSVNDESSTFQETNLWRNLSKVVLAKSEEEIAAAKALRSEWEDFARLTQQAMLLCLKSAEEKDGAWVSEL